MDIGMFHISEIAMIDNILRKYKININIFSSEHPGRGISSNGRAIALHAIGSGIDTRILQCFRLGYFFLEINLNDIYSFPLVFIQFSSLKYDEFLWI